MEAHKVPAWYILVPLILVSLVALGLAFRSFVMAEIVEPLALVVWLIARFFMSINQKVYWTGVILLVILAGFQFLPALRRRSAKGHYEEVKDPENRLEYWYTLIKQPKKRESLEENLQKLISSSGLNMHDIPKSRHDLEYIESVLKYIENHTEHTIDR